MYKIAKPLTDFDHNALNCKHHCTVVHGAVRAVHGAVGDVHGAVRAVHGAIRAVHGQIELCTGQLELCTEQLRLCTLRSAVPSLHFMCSADHLRTVKNDPETVKRKCAEENPIIYCNKLLAELDTRWEFYKLGTFTYVLS